MSTSTIEIRHPYVNEVPAELISGFESFRIDPDWQWVLVHDHHVVAQILCSYAHGMLIIMRLTAFPDAPHGWALAMFRHVLAECRGMGMLGYTVFLSDQSPKERRLMRIVSRAGGYLIPCSGAWAAGSFDTGY